MRAALVIASRVEAKGAVSGLKIAMHPRHPPGCLDFLASSSLDFKGFRDVLVGPRSQALRRSVVRYDPWQGMKCVCHGSADSLFSVLFDRARGPSMTGICQSAMIRSARFARCIAQASRPSRADRQKCPRRQTSIKEDLCWVSGSSSTTITRSGSDVVEAAMLHFRHSNCCTARHADSVPRHRRLPSSCACRRSLPAQSPSTVHPTPSIRHPGGRHDRGQGGFCDDSHREQRAGDKGHTIRCAT